MQHFKYLLFFFFALFFSCENFNFKKTDKLNINEALDLNINYTSIDAYPLLPECANIENRILQKDCFYNKLTSRIQHTLDNYFLEFTSTTQDTVLVKIIVNSSGKTRIKNIKSSINTKKNIPKLDSIIRLSINQLPVLQPAIKIGIPVEVEFTLPILID